MSTQTSVTLDPDTDNSIAAHDGTRAPAISGNGAPDGGGTQVPAPSPFEPLVERAISREVWEVRGYAPYYGRHHPNFAPDEVRDQLEPYDLCAGQRRT